MLSIGRDRIEPWPCPLSSSHLHHSCAALEERRYHLEVQPCVSWTLSNLLKPSSHDSTIVSEFFILFHGEHRDAGLAFFLWFHSTVETTSEGFVCNFEIEVRGTP